jgi:hypothetical protein
MQAEASSRGAAQPHATSSTTNFSKVPLYIPAFLQQNLIQAKFPHLSTAQNITAAVAPQRRRCQHRPLEHPDSIRLLHLLPGLFEDEIQVELREVTLSQQPRYEALSYVWSSPTADDPISCHGEELFVTASCIAAMRRMRHRKKNRVL